MCIALISSQKHTKFTRPIMLTPDIVQMDRIANDSAFLNNDVEN